MGATYRSPRLSEATRVLRMLQYRYIKSFIFGLLLMALMLAAMLQMSAWYRLFLPCENKVQVHVHDFDSEAQPDLKMLLRAVDAPPLMKNQKKLRDLANFTIQPSIALAKGAAHRWVAINVVKSAARNMDRRSVIRKTWASVNVVRGVRIETVFILGATEDEHLQSEIDKENQEYADILQMNTLDGYSSVPHKALAGMQWVAENTPGSWLYSSADDDVALHPENFVRFVDGIIKKHASLVAPDQDRVQVLSSLPIMCVYSYNEQDIPARDPNSKWYMSTDVYPPKIWPPYCRGGWYSFPVAVAEKLHRISRKTMYVYLDDVWITGIMRVKMLASQPNVTEETLLRGAIIAAPLSRRTDKELIIGKGEEDVEKVIVKHVWGNIAKRVVNVPLDLIEIWNKWGPTMQVADSKKSA